MAWPWEIAERDHELQNPTSPEKIRLLGSYLRLTAESRVLDLACGKAGPALILAETFGCRVLGVELREAFAEEGRARAQARGLGPLVEIRTADAASFRLEPEMWDAVLCLGASFVWGTLAEAAAVLAPAARPRGFVAVGEPFWREWPLPEHVDAAGYVPLDATAARLESAGLALTGIVAASEDDWDAYESLHWRAITEWLAEEPDHPDAGEIRATHERFLRDYLRYQRDLLGWAIFVGRKP